MSFDLALINNDISIKPDGSLRLVTGTDKLKQDVIKIILTPLNSSKFHSWYGSSISDDMIGEIPAESALFLQISNSISESLDRLRSLQLAQTTSQSTELAEMIASVRDISVQRAPDDPRQVNVVVSIIAKDLTAVEEAFLVT